jgi:hypothetical protein
MYVEDEEWRLNAPCNGKHPDLWFPPLDEDPNSNPYYALARQVCATCPVWNRCLEEGWEEKFGMWGGLTPGERNAAKASRGEVVTNTFRKAQPSSRALKHLRGHGSWMRFRQGCQCEECEVAQVAQMDDDPVSRNHIPNVGDSLNIDSLLYQLT